MASTSLEIVISANDRFSATADRVIGKLHGIGSASKQVGKGVGELGLGLAKVGAVGFVALAGGLAAASKAGIDFEDAFAGVRKTVGGSKAGLDAMYESLRQLATRIPVKFTDLASIATEAGALGVPAKEIVHFTEVIARLSAATQGLTVEAAAEAIGKLGNILHIHGADVDRFASSLVALGNAGASTEADIIETAKRFGAAGSAAKLTAAQVLGFSSAIASLGVEPEAAGSALSRIFNKVTLYIGTGNAKLKQFASTAGLSTAAFEKLFRGDSTKGLLAFLQGLGKLDRFQVAKVLKSAGITNIRDVNAVLLLAQNYGLLTDQLGVSSKAFEENTALTEASTQRFGTLKSKLQVVKNSILDAGASISEGLNPAIGRLADKLTAFVSSHKSDFVQFGKDIGRFIDDIDWTKVQKGAETFVDLMKTLLGVIQKIPPEVDAAVIGFLGLNRVSGGLLGKGIQDVVGGAVSLAFRGVGALLPGKLGGLVGALGAQPVFVTNWPLGGLGGGGLPGTPPVAGGGGGGGLLTFLKTLALGGVALKVSSDLAPKLDTANDRLLAIVHQGRDGGGGGVIEGIKGGPFVTDGGFDRRVTPSPITAGGFDSRITAAIGTTNRHLSSGFRQMVAALHSAKSDKSIAAAAKAAIASVIGKGEGNVQSTQNVLAELKTALTHTHDPKLAAILRADIRAVEAKLPGRQFAAKELRTADQILASNKTASQKIGDLKKLQHELLSHGLPHAAAQINARIDAARKAQVAAINNKDLNVSVTVKNTNVVSIRDNGRAQSQVSRYGFTLS